MIAYSADFPRRPRWLAFFLLVLFGSTVAFSTERKVWYLRFAEVAETLRMFADSGIPGSDIADSGAGPLDSWAGCASTRADCPRGARFHQ